MIPPELALTRFLRACILGAGLGFWYDFLRPPRTRHATLCDTLFLLASLWCFLILGFKICRGDLRFGYTGGLFLGGMLWELTLGRLSAPVFSWIWKKIQVFWTFICFLQKNFRILQNLCLHL